MDSYGNATVGGIGFLNVFHHHHTRRTISAPCARGLLKEKIAVKTFAEYGDICFGSIAGAIVLIAVHFGQGCDYIEYTLLWANYFHRNGGYAATRHGIPVEFSFILDRAELGQHTKRGHIVCTLVTDQDLICELTACRNALRELRGENADIILRKVVALHRNRDTA